MRISPLFQPALIALSVVTSIANTAQAADDIEHLAIFGNAQAVNDVPGSAHMISQAELEKFDFTDIMRTFMFLKKMAMVYVQILVCVAQVKIAVKKLQLWKTVF